MTEQINDQKSALFVCPGELAGQIALVTGAGRGIGRATALALAAAGARVVVASRSQKELDQTLALIEQQGGESLALTADVTQQDAVEQVVRQIEAQWGPIDILVNNAGSTSGLGSIADADPALWWMDIETSLRGTLLASHAVLPGMIARHCGRIINVASRIGVIPFPFASSYSVAKTSLIRFTEVLDLETREMGIRAFAIHPGEVRTQISPSRESHPRLPAVFLEAYLAQLHDTPELGANLITFLATGKADALSGCFINAHDDLSALIEHADTIQAKKLQRLRLAVE